MGFALNSCKSKFKQHDSLFDFQVKTKSSKSYYQVKNFKENDYVDKPRNIQSEQIGDTLKIRFEIFEGASTKILGNINFKKDSLILKIGKGIGIKELVLHEYEYKILNSSKNTYKTKIKNHVEIENLWMINKYLKQRKNNSVLRFGQIEKKNTVANKMYY